MINNKRKCMWVCDRRRERGSRKKIGEEA